MSEQRIRAGTVSDLPAVERLWSRLVETEAALGHRVPGDGAAGASWRASFERHLGRFAFLWVAEQEGEVVSFLLARLKTRPAYLGSELLGELSSIFVDPSARGQGVGSALVREAISTLRAQGAAAIEVDVHAGNEGARAFWEAQHFMTRACVYRLDVTA